MPNHVHVLMRPCNGFELEDVLKSIKGYTSTQINRMHGLEPPFWMKESYDHIVRDANELERIQGYIRANPQSANLSDGQFSIEAAEYRLEE